MSNQNNNRQLPRDEDAERGILGCMLSEQDTAMEALDWVSVDWFYDLRHRWIFHAIQSVNEDGSEIDPIMIQSKLKDLRKYDECGGAVYLAELADCVPSAKNLPYYAGPVRRKYLQRTIFERLRNSAKSVFDDSDPAALVAEIEQQVSALDDEIEPHAQKSTRDLVNEVIDSMENYTRGHAQLKGLPTGYEYFDKMVCGMKPGELVVFAARPGMGKTSLGMNIVEYCAVDLGKPVGVFSLEMTAHSLVERMLFQRGEVDYQRYRTGFFQKADFGPLTQAAGKIANSPIYIDDTSGLTLQDLRMKAKRMRRNHAVEMIVIDYVQLMQGQRQDIPRYQVVGEISKGCKALAKELNIPVVIMAQLSREFEKEKNRKPRLSDLRESGDIEQDADVIGFLYLDKKLMETDDHDWSDHVWPVNLLVAKQRNGPTGDSQLTFHKSFMKFKDRYRPKESKDRELPNREEIMEGWEVKA